MSWAKVIKTNTVPWELILKADHKFVFKPNETYFGQWDFANDEIEINLSAIYKYINRQVSPQLRDSQIRQYGNDIFSWPTDVFDAEQKVIDMIVQAIGHETIHEALDVEIEIRNIIAARVDASKEEMGFDESYWKFVRFNLIELFNQGYQELFVAVTSPMDENWKEATRIFEGYIKRGMDDLIDRYTKRYGHDKHGSEVMKKLYKIVEDSLRKVRQYIHNLQKELDKEFRKSISNVSKEIAKELSQKYRKKSKKRFGTGGKIKPQTIISRRKKEGKKRSKGQKPKKRKWKV